MNRRARGVSRFHSRSWKRSEAAGSTRIFEVANGPVVHARGVIERGPARRAAFVAERLGDEESVDVLHRLDVGVDGIEAEGGERTVGAGLAAGELVRRQDLQEPLAGPLQPCGTSGKVGDLTDSPVPGRVLTENSGRTTPAFRCMRISHLTA